LGHGGWEPRRQREKRSKEKLQDEENGSAREPSICDLRRVAAWGTGRIACAT
jgi:hypothetical protein